MLQDGRSGLYANDASDTVVVRQYLDLYKSIDYTEKDWRNKLLYALPIHPMTPEDNDAEAAARQYDEHVDVQPLQNF